MVHFEFLMYHVYHSENVAIIKYNKNNNEYFDENWFLMFYFYILYYTKDSTVHSRFIQCVPEYLLKPGSE